MNLIDPSGLDPEANADGTFRFIVNPANFNQRTIADLANVIVGQFVRHPNDRLSGQCATGAQLLTGSSVDGRMHDAPSTRTWTMGQPLSPHTPVGTMIASGWNRRGEYPNAPQGNHTAIYMGNGRVLEQNVGETGSYQIRALSAAEIAGFYEVNSGQTYDARRSQSTIGPTRNP